MTKQNLEGESIYQQIRNSSNQDEINKKMDAKEEKLKWERWAKPEIPNIAKTTK